MTRKERLMAIFKGKVPDRPALKLWSATPFRTTTVHPDYIPVAEKAVELTDLVAYCPGLKRMNIYCGIHADKLIKSLTKPTDTNEWEEEIITFDTPEGQLRRVFLKSTCNKPGYEQEHLLKEPGDIKKLLSMPYEQPPVDAELFMQWEREMGHRGIMMFGLDHAMYAIERHIGSENFAMWYLECPDLLMEAISVYSKRIMDYVNAAFDCGLKPVMGWVGPELCIPPLMPPAAFEKFVFNFDKPLCDLIHERGGYVWVHSHGKIKNFITRFSKMGVDVLNPIEPPPMGDLELPEAFEISRDRIGLEGNIETHDLMVASQDEVREKITAAIDAGNGHRFILCPSSGFQEMPVPGKQYIDNLMLYLNEGHRLLEACSSN